MHPIKKIAFMAWLLLLAPGVYALSTNYAEVLVENLQIGGTYDLTKLANMPLEVGNNSDKDVQIKVEPGKPAKLAAGFEPIPSPGWVKIKQPEFKLPAGSTFKTDIILTIPRNRKLLGRKFQVDILSKTKTEPAVLQAMQLEFGVTGRLLFTIAPVVRKDKQPQGAANLNYLVTPERLDVANVPLGAPFALQKPDGGKVEISNQGSETLELKVEALTPEAAGIETTDGYVGFPKADALTFDKTDLQLAGGAKEALGMTLQLPDRPEYLGQKYLFIVSVSPVRGAVAVHRHLRIYVTTSQAQPQGGAPQ